MRDSDYTIQNYHAKHFASFVLLKNEAQSLDAGGCYLSPQAIRESLRRPNYVPEQDLFLVEVSGEIVGYTDITNETGIGRVILDCYIQPHHRRRGLATRLFDYAGKRARALGAKIAHVNISRDNTIAQRVLVKLGFQPVRSFYELRLQLDKVFLPEITTRFSIGHFQKGDEDKLTVLQNRCFTGTWGYNPNTEEEVKYSIRRSNCELEGILIACDGDKPVGYCWTRLEYDEKQRSSKGRGRIFMVGVDPDYRNTGIGRSLLLAGLSYLQSRGLLVAQLTVDSENKVAFALYRSIGFEVHNSSWWYEKALD